MNELEKLIELYRVELKSRRARISRLRKQVIQLFFDVQDFSKRREANFLNEQKHEHR